MSAHGLTESYIERRLAQSDDAEKRCRALVSQNMRRFEAIETAVKRIGGVSDIVTQGTISGLSLLELLAEIKSDLEEANRVRSTDPQPEDGE